MRLGIGSRHVGKKGSFRKIKMARGVIFDTRVIKNISVEDNCLEWTARMQRRSATTRLIVEASRVLHNTLGILANSEHGTSMDDAGIGDRRFTL